MHLALKLDGDLIFFAIAFVMWIVGQIADRKRKQDQAERRQPDREPAPHESAPTNAPPRAPSPAQIPTPISRRGADRPSLTDSLAEQGRVHQATHATASEAMLRRRAAWARLGLDAAKGRDPRTAVRRAVLFAEVLGPPRARRGPHRPGGWTRKI